MGTGLAAMLMGAVAVASAQASLPSEKERAASRLVPAVAAPSVAARAHIAQPRFVFASPLAGYPINSPFGLRKMPWEEGGRLHEGVDIAAPGGTAVRATLAGVVVRSGVDGGYGRFVEIEHESGLTSLYGHLGSHAKDLKVGGVVAAGAVLGYVGSSGRSTGSHLHFEIRQDGKPLNPALFIDKVFMTEADLPLTAAARFSRSVRIAQVASWPAGLRRKAADPATVNTASSLVTATRRADGRVHAVIQPPAAYAKPTALETIKPAPVAVPAPVVREADDHTAVIATS